MPITAHKEKRASTDGETSAASRSGFFSSSNSVLFLPDSLDTKKHRTRQLCEENGLDANALLEALRAECEKVNKEEDINRVIGALSDLQIKAGISYLQFQKRPANQGLSGRNSENPLEAISSMSAYISSIVICIVSVPLGYFALYSILDSSLALSDELKLLVAIVAFIIVEFLLCASSLFLRKLSYKEADHAEDSFKDINFNPFHDIVKDLTEFDDSSVDFSDDGGEGSFAENDTQDDHDDRLPFRA